MRAHHAAALAAEEAARAERDYVIDTMRGDGYSYADIAGAVGLTKGRIGQLVNA